MALSGKREELRLVPWFSLAEWHQVYKQIYSNDARDQIKAYETLLAWKVRIPKLPVGVDCTLSILQVCLRDREWTPKINNGELPVSYLNDLCLMYSTAIMRFLNHISNIGHTKQTSLFQIAKQLKIPEWIVNLRHDAAHGHELPSIDVLRITVNILLTWLHEEYWVAETKALEEYYSNEVEMLEIEEYKDIQEFKDIMELWTTISLYMHAGFHLVNTVPDIQLQKTLKDLYRYALNLSQQNDKIVESRTKELTSINKDDTKNYDKYALKMAQSILNTEISRYLGKNKQIASKEDIVLNTLLEIEAFLPSTKNISIFFQNQVLKDIFKENLLPIDMIKFWKDIIILLHDADMLGILIIKLLELVKDEQEIEYKRHLAALWINSILRTFIKLNIAHEILEMLEMKSNYFNKKTLYKVLRLQMKEELDKKYPNSKHIPMLNILSTVPRHLTDMNFVYDLALNVNKFSNIFMPLFLDLVTSNMDVAKKKCLLRLIEIYTQGKFVDKTYNSKIDEQLFTMEDLSKIRASQNKSKLENSVILVDKTIRNTHWKPALENFNWKETAIGILPWQTDSLEYLEPINVTSVNCNVSTFKSLTVPGLLENSNLKMQSQINWDMVLRKKRKLKRKLKKTEKRSIDVIINRAIEMFKK